MLPHTASVAVLPIELVQGQTPPYPHLEGVWLKTRLVMGKVDDAPLIRGKFPLILKGEFTPYMLSSLYPYAMVLRPNGPRIAS